MCVSYLDNRKSALFAARVVTLVIYVAGCCCRHRLRRRKCNTRQAGCRDEGQATPKRPRNWRIENFPTLERAKAAPGEYRWNPDTVS